MEQGAADPRVVQQLMFNRTLSFVRSLSVEGVTVVGLDATTGTLACSHAGVTSSSASAWERRIQLPASRPH